MSPDVGLFEFGELGTLRPARALRDDSPAIDPTRPSAPHNRTTTSRDAARAMRPKLPGLQRLVLAMLRDAGERGATREELAAMSTSYGRTFALATACSIVHRLSRRGMVRTVGTRLSSSGRRAEVLTLSVIGEQVIEGGQD